MEFSLFFNQIFVTIIHNIQIIFDKKNFELTVENPDRVTESCYECGARVTECGCNACVPSTIASDLASSPKKKTLT